MRHSGNTAGLPDRWGRGRFSGMPVVFPAPSHNSHAVFTFCPEGERNFTCYYVRERTILQLNNNLSIVWGGVGLEESDNRRVSCVFLHSSFIIG